MSVNQSPTPPFNQSSQSPSNSTHNPIHPHDTYNLQGVIRYLQLEYSRAEEHRINWANDRSELKSIIGKLTGEIRSLKEINRKLEHELDFYRAKEEEKPTNGNNFKNKNISNYKDEDFTLRLNEPNMAPLVDAKKYLLEKKQEIDLLLKDNVKPVNDVLAVHKKHVLSLNSPSIRPPSVSVPEKATPSSSTASTPVVNAKFVTNASTSNGSQVSRLDASNPTTTSTAPPDNEEETAEDLLPESDAETIREDTSTEFDESEAPETPSSSVSPSAQDAELEETETNGGLIAELAGHLTAISQISLEDDTLLSSSKDGAVKIWNLLDRVQAEQGTVAQLSPTRTIYTGSDPLRFLKWLNNKFFVLLTKENVLKCYNAQSFKNVAELKLDLGEVISLDVSEQNLVVLSNTEKESNGSEGSRITCYQLNVNGESVSINGYKKTPFENFNDKLSFLKIDVNDTSKFYGYSKSGKFIEEFNLKTEQLKSLTFKEDLTTNLTDLKIFHQNMWLLIAPSGFKLYNKSSRDILYDYTAPRSQLTNVDFNEKTKQLLTYHNNGEIQIHTLTADKTYNITKSLSHYDPVLSNMKSFDELSSEEKSILTHSWNLGLVYGNENCITAGEDTFIRVFKIN